MKNKIFLLLIVTCTIHSTEFNYNRFQRRQEGNILPIDDLEKLAKALAEDVSSLPTQPVAEGKHKLALPRTTPETFAKTYSVCVLAAKLLSKKDALPVECSFEADPTATQTYRFGEERVGNFVIQAPEGARIPDKKTLEKDYLEALERYGRAWNKIPSPEDVGYRIYTRPHEHISYSDSGIDTVGNLTHILWATGLEGKAYGGEQPFAYLKTGRRSK